MNCYGGFIDREGTALVSKNGEELSPARSQEVWNHSPTGFHWGYHGSGPAQLALALLLEEIPRWRALALYQDFKREVIAKLDPTPLALWRMTSDEIREWVRARPALSQQLLSGLN